MWHVAPGSLSAGISQATLTGLQDLIFDEYGWFYEDHINGQRNRVCGIAAAVVITELGSFGSPVSLRPLT